MKRILMKKLEISYDDCLLIIDALRQMRQLDRDFEKEYPGHTPFTSNRIIQTNLLIDELEDICSDSICYYKEVYTEYDEN